MGIVRTYMIKNYKKTHPLGVSFFLLGHFTVGAFGLFKSSVQYLDGIARLVLAEPAAKA